MPCGASSGGKKTGNNRATATRAFGTRMRTLFAEVNAPETRMAVAGSGFGGGEIFLLVGKGEVAGPGVIGRGKTGELGASRRR